MVKSDVFKCEDLTGEWEKLKNNMEMDVVFKNNYKVFVFSIT